MIDIHAHLIPNVDDGSPSIEASLEMLRHSVSIGVTDIICTPHFTHKEFVTPVEKIKEQFDLLNKAKEAEGIKANLYLGQEILYTSRENIISMLDEGKLLTLNNTKFVLLEFNIHHRPDELEDVIYHFTLHKYRPIIAHIERYKWLTMEDILMLKSLGCKISINADAIIGKNGFQMKHICKKVLKKELIDYITSDMHHFRPSNLDKALKKVKKENYFNNYEIIK